MKMAIFASGNGSNFEAIANYQYDFLKVVLLICDRDDAYVLKRSKRLQIPSYVFLPKNYPNKQAYETQILKVLNEHLVDVVILAGYMRVVGEKLLKAFPNKIINIHPSVLPSYKGLNAIKKAYQHNEKEIGITVHYVNEYIDGGKIIAQKSFLVGDMSFEEVERKVHQLEHKLYPEVLKSLFDRRKT